MGLYGIVDTENLFITIWYNSKTSQLNINRLNCYKAASLVQERRNSFDEGIAKALSYSRSNLGMSMD